MSEPAAEWGEAEEVEPYYPDLASFVRGIVLPVFLRRVDGRTRTWCTQWWEHPEAVLRLEALWRSWEAGRLDVWLGMSSWLRDHADYHLVPLLDPDGSTVAELKR